MRNILRREGLIYQKLMKCYYLYFRQYETENAKRKAENRASEVNNVISAPGSSKVAWEQLGSFINFNAARGAHETDKSRMKSLLFKLKQEPPKVPTH